LNVFHHIYSKEYGNKNLKVREEVQEYPNKPLEEAFMDKLKDDNKEEESVVGLTTKKLADRMNQQGIKISNNSIYENYLRHLTKQGVINSVPSVINGKENIYYPVNQENEDNVLILPLTEDCRLIINNQLDEKNVLEESLETLSRRRSNGGVVNKYKIIDIDGSEISLTDLLEIFFLNENHYTSCSVIKTKYYNNDIDESSIVDEKSEVVTEEDNDIEQPSNQSGNSFIDESKCCISSNSCSGYRYTPHQIEEFFASENGQEEEHASEESVCRPLIGKQIHKPFFHYCKEDPKIEFQNLISIENHIKLKDYERHKAKLLEMYKKNIWIKMKAKMGKISLL
jgi:ribosomal protein S25